jgi:hypothetical protein
MSTNKLQLQNWECIFMTLTILSIRHNTFTQQLSKETNWDKLHALLYLRSKYENENRTEEAAIVSELISEEEADEIREYDGF